ncbi:MAG TPA: PHB depolymerase family esterase [Burkholderiales bacterium]|nr:PHB depolymerase family esterase [Burkholderiales bacterium]
MPAPGRFSVNRKSSLHGFINVAPAPPWREYLLYLPRNFDAIERPALVVWLHGCRQDPEAFAAGTRIARFADQRGFIVLLPRQSRMANSERCWNWFDRRTAHGKGETAIVAAQAAEVIDRFRVDPGRVYVAGLSSGGTLAATLALREPRLFAAAAIHSSLPCGAATDAHDAARAMIEGPRAATDALAVEARALAGDKARLPVLVIHGAADRNVAPVNSVFLVRQFLLFNGLAPEKLPAGASLPPANVRPFQPRVADYLAADYHAGRRLAARLITIPGLGHAWSGGDPALEFFDSHRIDATPLICDFFASHSRR